MRAALVFLLLAASSNAIAKPTPEPFPLANLPDVTRVQDKLGASSGVVEREGATVVVASPKHISVDGRVLIEIDHGAVDPAEKDGGANGIKLPRLAASLPGAAPVELAIDRSLTYQLLVQTVFSAKEGGRSKFSLLVRAGGAVVAVPLVLPANSPRRVVVTTKSESPLGMLVSVSKTEVLVRSMSGNAGTLKKPLLRIALDEKADEVARANTAMQVRSTLENVAKRWKGKKRPPETQSIFLMCDPTTSMQFVAELMVAMRPQFSDIGLVAGFE